jgi:hypothetical protein
MRHIPNAGQLGIVDLAKRPTPWTPHQTVRRLVAASLAAWAIIVGLIIVLV